MTSARTAPRLSTLILLTAASTLSLNMFVPSLAQIAADLNAPYATVSLAVAGYLAITAVIQLIVGPLSDRLGRRPVMLGALGVFAAASLACAFATNVWVFLAFRMLQGGMIAGSALSMAIVRDTRSEREAAGLLGYISMAMAVAPMLGPMIGGVLDSAFGWRANFYLYTLTGLGLLVLCWVDLGETKPATATARGSMRAGLRALLQNRRFWAYAACNTFSTGAFYIFITGAPLVARTQFGVSTAELGVFTGSITAGFMCGSFVAARLATRVNPTHLMLGGRVLACGGLSAGVLAILSGVETPLFFFGSTIFVGLGNGITMPSCNAAALSVRADLAGTASGVKGAMVVAGGAVFSSLTGILLPAEAPGLTLLLMMLTVSFAGLLAVLYASRINEGGAPEVG